jgi:hypothetical protein
MIDKTKISVILKVLNNLRKEGTRMKKSFPLLMMILPLITFFVTPKQIYAVEEEEIMILIETAKTPEDHIKIAEFYEEKAQKMENMASKHIKMGNSYRNRSKPMPAMVKNCSELANEYKAAAEEYKKMAAEHRKMGEELQAE